MVVFYGLSSCWHVTGSSLKLSSPGFVYDDYCCYFRVVQVPKHGHLKCRYLSFGKQKIFFAEIIFIKYLFNYFFLCKRKKVSQGHFEA